MGEERFFDHCQLSLKIVTRVSKAILKSKDIKRSEKELEKKAKERVKRTKKGKLHSW